MAKVLLVSTPFYRLQGSHYNGINLGLGYLSSVLEACGVECKMYNADYLPGDSYANQVELFNHYSDYKKLIRNTEHPIWQECVAQIEAYNPDWVGFSMFTANLPSVDILSRLVKKRLPHSKIVVGGPHVTLAEDEVLREAEGVDFAIIGEGERSLVELVTGVPYNKIRGLIYRECDRIVVNPKGPFVDNLDVLPFPKRNNFIPDGVRIQSHHVITSRGCPNKCAFCASPVIWRKQVRFRTIENVIEELRQMKESGYRYIYFLDDTFTFKKKRILKLLERMREEKMNFEWACETRLNCLDEDILAAMKKSGCVRLKVGIESGNMRILNMIDKGITPKLVLEKTALIRKFGLPLTAYFMIGFPGETDAEALDTIELAKRIEADYYSLSVVAPYYGTRLYNEFANNNGHKKIRNNWEYFFHQSREMILTSKISKEVVDKFLALNDFGRGNRI